MSNIGYVVLLGSLISLKLEVKSPSHRNLKLFAVSIEKKQSEEARACCILLLTACYGIRRQSVGVCVFAEGGGE